MMYVQIKGEECRSKKQKDEHVQGDDDTVKMPPYDVPHTVTGR